MMTILSTLGGAAAMKLLNKNKTPADVKQLRKQEEHLKKLVKDLEKEAKDSNSEKELALAELRKQAEELRVQVAEAAEHLASLKEANGALKEQNTGLHESLTTQGSRLFQQEAMLTALIVEKEELTTFNKTVLLENSNLTQKTSALTSEMEALKEVHDTTVRQFEAQLEELRGAVSAVVGRMLAHTITNAEAANAVRALGCEIEYVEVPASVVETDASEKRDTATDASEKESLPWTFQPGMLLGTAEGREKLQRLVASGMMRNNEGGNKATTRLPVITFPSHFSGPQRAAAGAGALLSNRGASGTPKGLSGDVNATQRDQQPAAATRTGRPAPVITTGTTPKKAAQASSAGLSWTYALQGGSGNTYLAKVPVVGGDQPGPAAYFSTSPALAPALPGHAGGLLGGDSMHDSMPFTTPNDMGLVSRP